MIFKRYQLACLLLLHVNIYSVKTTFYMSRDNIDEQLLVYAQQIPIAVRNYYIHRGGCFRSIAYFFYRDFDPFRIINQQLDLRIAGKNNFISHDLIKQAIALKELSDLPYSSRPGSTLIRTELGFTAKNIGGRREFSYQSRGITPSELFQISPSRTTKSDRLLT